MAYNASIQAEWDWQNAVELAEERAEKRGAAKERAKAEARERELMKEAEAEKRASAKKMIKAGLPVEQVAEFTSLPISVIKKL